MKKAEIFEKIKKTDNRLLDRSIFFTAVIIVMIWYAYPKLEKNERHDFYLDKRNVQQDSVSDNISARLNNTCFTIDLLKEEVELLKEDKIKLQKDVKRLQFRVYSLNKRFAEYEKNWNDSLK
jgi:FtsZ-binding cell division protein ZapB